MVLFVLRKVGKKSRFYLQKIHIFLKYLDCPTKWVLRKYQKKKLNSKSKRKKAPNSEYPYIDIFNRKQQSSSLRLGNMERPEIKKADMADDMRDEVYRVTKEALQRNYDLETKIAAHIKLEFDKLYGPGWQCIVGTFVCVIWWLEIIGDRWGDLYGLYFE